MCLLLVALLLLLLGVSVVVLPLLPLLPVPGVPIAGDDVALPHGVPLAPHPRAGLLLLLDWDRGPGHVLQQEILIKLINKYVDGTQSLVFRVPSMSSIRLFISDPRDSGSAGHKVTSIHKSIGFDLSRQVRAGSRFTLDFSLLFCVIINGIIMIIVTLQPLTGLLNYV